MSTRDYTRDGFPSGRALRLSAATVAGVALLGVGVAVGRATGGGGSAPATGGQPGSGAIRRVPSWATGATRMDHGVPVGYAHTAEGAIDAARNYDLALSSTPLALDPQAYRDARTLLEVPGGGEDAAKTERTLAASADLIAAVHQGHATRVEPFIVTSRVDGYSADDAQVTVWGGVVFGSDGVQFPVLALGETTYSLRWLGDWRILTDAGAPGPGVTATTRPAQTSELPPELGRDFEGVGHVVPQ